MTLISYLTQKLQSPFFRSAPPPYSHKGFSKLDFKKKAFTLAEVLITLTIIGVVAAMTIPTLMSKYQKHTYVVGLKKAYSQLQNAVKMIPITEGCPSGDYECAPVNIDSIAKQFKLGKNIYDCNLGGRTWLEAKCLQLQDGTIISLSPHYYYPSSTIGVDINGDRGPNLWGRDRFSFEIYSSYTAPGIVVATGSKKSADLVHDPNHYWNANPSAPHCTTQSVNAKLDMDKGNTACAGRVLEEDAMNY